jgi:hypothetical protein
MCWLLLYFIVDFKCFYFSYNIISVRVSLRMVEIPPTVCMVRILPTLWTFKIPPTLCTVQNPQTLCKDNFKIYLNTLRLNEDSAILYFLTMAITYDFPVEFQGIDEVLNVKLKSNLSYLESLKLGLNMHMRRNMPKLSKFTNFFIMNHTLISQVRVLGLTMQKRNTIGERYRVTAMCTICFAPLKMIHLKLVCMRPFLLCNPLFFLFWFCVSVSQFYPCIIVLLAC